MKLEMLDFVLHLSGFDEFQVLQMKAPQGQRVFDWPRKQPMTRMERYHVRHFPNSSYDFGRYGSRGVPYASMAYGGYYAVAAGTAVFLTTAPYVIATDRYPQVSGKTYQTAMSGQPAGSDSRLVFNTGEGIFSYFRRGWQ
jgi:hypothetical protein